MAIIERPGPDSPFSQGDILSDVQLFCSKKTLDGTTHQATPTKHDICLVLSRACVVAHKPTLVVAQVAKYPEEPTVDDSLDEIVDFFETLRDGIGSPDLFYLGQLPELRGRYCARLDSLHTLEISSKPEDRKAYFAKHRIGKLCPDYIRDLHLRLFSAFVSMGFVDYEWLSDQDLETIIAKGNAEITLLQNTQELGAKFRELSDKASDTKQVAKEEKAIESLRRKMLPYVSILNGRRSSPNPIQEPGEG